MARFFAIGDRDGRPQKAAVSVTRPQDEAPLWHPPDIKISLGEGGGHQPKAGTIKG